MLSKEAVRKIRVEAVEKLGARKFFEGHLAPTDEVGLGFAWRPYRAGYVAEWLGAGLSLKAAPGLGVNRWVVSAVELGVEKPLNFSADFEQVGLNAALQRSEEVFYHLVKALRPLGESGGEA